MAVSNEGGGDGAEATGSAGGSLKERALGDGGTNASAITVIKLKFLNYSALSHKH